MSIRRMLMVAALAAVAGAADDPGEALWLPASSPRLEELARSWQGRQQALVDLLSAADPAVRRGAARLAGRIAAIPAATLIAAAADSRDPEVRRLLASALLGRLDGCAPGDLLRLPDPSLACLLLARHPAADALADPQVHRQVEQWLRDRAACADAATLVAGRGTAAAWAPVLVEAFDQAAAPAFRDQDAASAQAMAVALHDALQVLTRTQRSLAVYAGHLESAAKDWRDVLAARGVAEQTVIDAEVLNLIADLPQAGALTGLLARGTPVLHALDQAMAGADRGRRRELAAAARLVARRVGPALWRELGEAGFEDMDAEDSARRLACLRRCAEAVRRLKDADGPMHLLAWTDDRDAQIRATALDLLVRLSDNRKDFRRDWSVAGNGCFPPGDSLWRLRRSLARGEADERVAALLFIAGAKATDLRDEVAAQLLAPSGMVVDTALETLGHLGDEEDDAVQLAVLRLAGDARQPAQRRIKALAVVGNSGRGSTRLADGEGEDAPKAVDTILKTLVEDADPAVRRAAAGMVIVRGGAKSWSLVTRMLGGAVTDRQTALSALGELTVKNLHEESPGGVPLMGLVIDHLADGDDGVAGQAADLVLDKLHGNGSQSLTAVQRTATADRIRRQRQALQERIRKEGSARMPCLALAVRSGLLPCDQALEILRTRPAGEAGPVWQALAACMEEPASFLDAVISLHGGRQLPEDLARTVLDAAAGACAFNPRLVAEVVASGDANLVLSSVVDTKYDDGIRTVTVTDPRGRILVLEGRPPAGGNAWEDDGLVVTVASAPTDPPTDAQVASVAERLGRLRLDEGHAIHRDLLACVLAGRAAPLERLGASANQQQKLWRLLAHRDPAVRAALVAWCNQQADISIWTLRPLLRDNEADLLPAVVAALTASTNEYVDSRVLSWLASLDKQAVAPHLPRLVLHPQVGRKKEIRVLLQQAGSLPVTALLEFIAARRRIEVRCAPWGETEQAAVSTALAGLAPDAVLDLAAMLRQVRNGNAQRFDGLLAPLVAGGDARAAAWLRTGIPAEAGLRDAYRDALASPVPDLWLVGAALALKEDRLAPAAFLERVASLPPESLGTAAVVANRYLAARCADQDARLAPILAHAPASHLPAWITLCPPGPQVVATLAERVRDPATARLISPALRQRLEADRPGWLPALRTLAAAAKGRLDLLIPR